MAYLSQLVDINEDVKQSLKNDLSCFLLDGKDKTS